MTNSHEDTMAIETMRKFVVTFLTSFTIFLIGQTAVAIWWAATVTASLDFTNKQLIEQGVLIKQLQGRTDPDQLQEFEITNLQKALQVLESRVEAMDHKKSDPGK